MSERLMRLGDLPFGALFEVMPGDLREPTYCVTYGPDIEDESAVAFVRLGNGHCSSLPGSVEVQPIDLPALLAEHAEMVKLFAAVRTDTDAQAWEERGRALEREACARVVEAGGDEVDRLETAIALGANVAIAEAIRARALAPVLLPADRQAAEIERLRSALERIAEGTGAATAIARAALEQQP